MSNISLPAGLAVEQVSQDKAVTQAAAFGIFATWALIQVRPALRRGGTLAWHALHAVLVMGRVTGAR